MSDLSQLARNPGEIEKTVDSYGKNKFWQGFFLGIAITAFSYSIYYSIKENYQKKEVERVEKYNPDAQRSSQTQSS